MVLDLHFSPLQKETPQWLVALVVNDQGDEINYVEFELSRSDSEVLSTELELLLLLSNTMSAYHLKVVSKDTAVLENYLKAHMPLVFERLDGGVVHDMDAFIRLLAELPLERGLLGYKVGRLLQSENTLRIYGYYRLYEDSIKKYLSTRSMG